MVSAQAGGIADLEQSIKLRFELGQRAEDVYRSDNWFIEALSSLLFDLKITLNQDLGEKVSEVASEMGVPDQIQAAAKSFGLFQGANLNLRFRSPNQLPSKLKEAAAKLLRKD